MILGFGMFPVEGRTIVPLAGMMIGNSMTASVLVGRRIVGELSDKRDEVEARLALGHSWPDAVAALRALGAAHRRWCPRSSRRRRSGWCSCPGR